VHPGVATRPPCALPRATALEKSHLRRLNRADDPVAYAAAIRAHLDANSGGFRGK